ALQQNKVSLLPIKTSKTKIKKRFFNYLVVLSPENKITIQKREEKGIWQHLYEFPVIETSKNINLNELLKRNSLKNYKTTEVTLFNSKPIIHKLSHQHIQANFWIIKCNKSQENSINISNLKNYPVSTLIDNFIKDFKW
ncbi:MAG: A/G-specific adenine glycosylase, partial [Gammaproteobacteria bacterium]